MPRISLAPHTVRIRRKYSSELEQLDSFTGDEDFFVTLEGYLQELLGAGSTDAQASTVLRIEAVHPSTSERTLSGKLQTGDYGYETDLWNVETLAVSYRRQNVDAEMRPFYYLFSVPKGVDEGILILERVGNLGVVGVLHEELRRLFARDFPDYLLELNALVPEEAIDRIVESGRIRSIRFVRFEIPSDIADAYALGGHEEGVSELVIIARRGGSFPFAGTLKDLFRSGGGGGVIEVDGGDFPYDTVKIEAKVGRSTRTVDISNLGRVRAYYDVTDDVERGADGHATLESLDEVGRELLANLNEALYS